MDLDKIPTTNKKIVDAIDSMSKNKAEDKKVKDGVDLSKIARELAKRNLEGKDE